MICVYPADCTDFSTNGNGTIEPSSAQVTENLPGGEIFRDVNGLLRQRSYAIFAWLRWQSLPGCGLVFCFIAFHFNYLDELPIETMLKRMSL